MSSIHLYRAYCIYNSLLENRDSATPDLQSSCFLVTAFVILSYWGVKQRYPSTPIESAFPMSSPHNSKLNLDLIRQRSFMFVDFSLSQFHTIPKISCKTLMANRRIGYFFHSILQKLSLFGDNLLSAPLSNVYLNQNSSSQYFRKRHKVRHFHWFSRWQQLKRWRPFFSSPPMPLRRY